jgi:hypothetical protein
LRRLARESDPALPIDPQTAATRVLQVAHVVAMASRHTPTPNSCLHRSLALWWLLRRRGFDSHLRFGARRQQSGFEAHAWVEHNGVVVFDDLVPTGLRQAVLAAARTRRMSYASVSGHRSMALDATRNQLYREALQQAVRPDSVVLDLGAGTGIHGLIAARLGARRVYLVEPEDILTVAEEIVAANGLQERVRCLRGRLEDIQLPEPVDIIVSAVTGNFLLTEDLLPTLFHARATALKPGCFLIPGAATMEATPVSAPTIHAKEIAGWSASAEGLDLSPARSYAANSVFYRLEELGDVAYLAEPRVLQTFDFSRDNYTSVHIEAFTRSPNRASVRMGGVVQHETRRPLGVDLAPRRASSLVARVPPSRSPCRVRARRASLLHARSRPVRRLDLASSVRDH